MLREFGTTRQEPGDLRRRWFSSPRCDLILWLNEDESLRGFQLCYDKPSNEHALTWIQDSGFSHMAVDSGEGWGPGKAAPILVADGLFEPKQILDVLEAECAMVPADYYRLIVEKISELVESRKV
jgi:hypothetical protein